MIFEDFVYDNKQSQFFIFLSLPLNKAIIIEQNEIKAVALLELFGCFNMLPFLSIASIIDNKQSQFFFFFLTARKPNLRAIRCSLFTAINPPW